MPLSKQELFLVLQIFTHSHTNARLEFLKLELAMGAYGEFI
jgi:hypothetical protein